jgi:hypothetical protein
VRQTAGLFVFLWGRRRVPMLVGTALGALPLVAYSWIAFGAPLEQGYGAKPFDAPVLTGLYGLLLSPSRGLFVYEPWTLFALGALGLAWRRRDEVALRLRGAAFTVVGSVLLYASYAEWWGGRVFGPRFLDDLAPLLVAALAWGVGEGLLRSRAALVAFWASVAWSLALFNAAALAYSNERWDMTPANVNFAPERLFAWSDPQWLSVLRDALAGGPRVLAAALISALLVVLLLRVERVLVRDRPIRSAA